MKEIKCKVVDATVAYFLTKNESNHNYSVTFQGSIVPQIALHLGNKSIQSKLTPGSLSPITGLDNSNLIW